jgi:hypothetical protein
VRCTFVIRLPNEPGILPLWQQNCDNDLAVSRRKRQVLQRRGFRGRFFLGPSELTLGPSRKFRLSFAMTAAVLSSALHFRKGCVRCTFVIRLPNEPGILPLWQQNCDNGLAVRKSSR